MILRPGARAGSSEDDTDGQIRGMNGLREFPSGEQRVRCTCATTATEADCERSVERARLGLNGDVGIWNACPGSSVARRSASRRPAKRSRGGGGKLGGTPGLAHFNLRPPSSVLSSSVTDARPLTVEHSSSHPRSSSLSLLVVLHDHLHSPDVARPAVAHPPLFPVKLAALCTPAPPLPRAMLMTAIPNDVPALAQPQERRFNPYADNGGTILAIAGADFSVIAGDTRQTEGYSIQTRYAPKVFRL